jgi:hypothetical protein
MGLDRGAFWGRGKGLEFKGIVATKETHFSTIAIQLTQSVLIKMMNVHESSTLKLKIGKGSGLGRGGFS